MLAPNAALRSQIMPGDPDQAAASTRTRMSWAQLLKCVFAIATCPQCGGPLTIIAAIEDPTVIAKILAHLGLPTRAQPRDPTHLDEFLQTT